MVNSHTSSWQSENLNFDWMILSKAYKELDEKSIEEFCVMTMKSDAKFEEKLILVFKNDMKNLKKIQGIYL